MAITFLDISADDNSVAWVIELWHEDPRDENGFLKHTHSDWLAVVYLEPLLNQPKRNRKNE